MRSGLRAAFFVLVILFAVFIYSMTESFLIEHKIAYVTVIAGFTTFLFIGLMGFIYIFFPPAINRYLGPMRRSGGTSATMGKQPGD